MKKIGFFFLLLTGCSANPVVPLTSPETITSSLPEVGVIQTQELGGRIASISSYDRELVLEVLYPTTFGKKEDDTTAWTCGLTIAPTSAYQRGTYEKERKGKKISADCFGPLIAGLTEPDGIPSDNCWGQTGFIDVCRNNEDMTFFVVYPYSLMGRVEIPLLQDLDNLEVHEAASDRSTYILADVIYDGLSNESLQFTYNEYAPESSRPVSSLKFSFNALTASTIEIKELRFEIINMTGTALTYRRVGP